MHYPEYRARCRSADSDRAWAYINFLMLGKGKNQLLFFPLYVCLYSHMLIFSFICVAESAPIRYSPFKRVKIRGLIFLPTFP
jgi:hypothetical protein